jgi:uncharacterized iron-regulated membrane protein
VNKPQRKPSFWSRLVRRPQSLWLRKALFQVHLWSGITIGLYVTVISISGCVLIYRGELRRIFSPEPRTVAINGEALSPEDLGVAAQRLYPDHEVEVYDLPEDPTHAVTVAIFRDGSMTQLLFDPYTGAFLQHALPRGWRFTSWLLDFHDNLLSGTTGRAVNGIGAIVLTLLSVTGAFIWWPGAQTWRGSMLMARRSNWKQTVWSLHSALGFWSVLFVVMWGITGIYLCFPEPFTALADAIEPIDEVTFEPRWVDGVLYWLAYLHFGRFGGLPTKIVWTVLGVVPPILFATGSVMWWNRVVRPYRDGALAKGPRGEP